MTKERKEFNNLMVRSEYENACVEWESSYKEDCGKLRTCNAVVYETPNYYWLMSYKTIVAFIDKESDTLYDVLRLVYGYTATSAQHIAKFSKDYGRGKWGCERSYRYEA